MAWLARLRRHMAVRRQDIDARIARHLGAARMRAMHVCVRELPAYRLIDVARSVEAEAAQLAVAEVIASQHDCEDLKDLLTAPPHRYVPRRINVAAREAWPVGPGQTAYAPKDCFWIGRAAASDGGWVVLRVQHQPQRDCVVLEVAAETSAMAEALLDTQIERATRESIYRRRLLTVSFEAGIKDEFGDVERAPRLNVFFRPEETFDEEAFIVDDGVREVLRRNVIDLHLRRELLKEHGVPVRRGVLLYGPPGTGKTFTCRYLCAQLPDVTRFVVAGMSLLQVRSIFNLARLLQPSLVILEDVDLVFAARDLTGDGAGLGELLDQMDGLRPFEDVSVILTTNALDRLEAAIKDRPGRISQCVHIGPPNDPLRRRYLLRHLARYALDGLDLDALVHLSRGTTQAFLKEWVHRAAQIALERPLAGDRLAPRTDDFRSALAEMRRGGDPATDRLIGFHDA